MPQMKEQKKTPNEMDASIHLYPSNLPDRMQRNGHEVPHWTG